MRGEAGDGLGLLDHFVDTEAFFCQGASGAGLHALSAGGAIRGVAPVVFQVAYDAGVDAARGNFPDVGAFNFCADPYAARAENAAIVIKDEARVAHVYLQARVVVGVADVGDAERLRHGLQLAMAVGDAGRADVVALDEEQFDGHAAILCELGR